ncbi:MAG: hypothetical protein PVF89_04990 [Lysobacterales bacterium]|jgi:hypothetical protein
METFAEVRQHVMENHELFLDEPFQIAFEYAMPGDERKQSIFLAEIKASDNRRYLRVETLICPLEHFDAEKCLRINLILRVGYLAVGDLEGTPYIKMCENMAYSALNGEELEYVIQHLAPMADRMEETLEEDGDFN